MQCHKGRIIIISTKTIGWKEQEIKEENKEKKENKGTAKDRNSVRRYTVGNGVKEERGIICEGWRDGWRNASVNPCVRAAAQCQVSACEWACVTAVSPPPGRAEGRWERRSCSEPHNRNVFMSMTEQQREQTTVRNTEKNERKKVWRSSFKCRPLYLSAL